MRYHKSHTWIILGAAALLLRAIASTQPQWVEQYYSRGLFVPIRWLLDYSSGLLPFPFIYVFVPLLLGWLGWRTRRWWLSAGNWRSKAASAARGVLALLGATVFFFLFIWGFNYLRTPVSQHMGLQPSPLDQAALWAELQIETDTILYWRTRIPGADTAALGPQHFPPHLEHTLREALKAQLQHYGYGTPGRVRGHLIYPKGIFLYFSSSGLYFPFTGQGHVDGGLHVLQWPYTLAHEMAHGYGFGDEGICNFWAYLACAHATSHPAIKYAGHLAHWRTLAANYQRYDYDGYWAFRDTLPAGIRADLDAINQNLLAYPDIMPRARYAAYNTYLKAQGISEGMMNYNSVIMMVKAWRDAQAQE